MLEFPPGCFVLTLEVVPPRGPDAEPLLQALVQLAPLSFAAFSVASNPTARPHLSALGLSALIRQRIGKPVILHCTPRDHNRLSLQGLLWAARALGIETVLATTGDRLAPQGGVFTGVDEMDLSGLIGLAVEAGLQVGVVLNPHPEPSKLKKEVDRLRRKVEAGARFVVTQPVYTEARAAELAEALRPAGAPALLGILPLRTARHAEFLHRKMAGIEVPEEIRSAMAAARNPQAMGMELARRMLDAARRLFQGACLMPPFGRYGIAAELLERRPTSGI